MFRHSLDNGGSEIGRKKKEKEKKKNKKRINELRLKHLREWKGKAWDMPRYIWENRRALRTPTGNKLKRK